MKTTTDAHTYRCTRCRRTLTLAMSPSEYRRATGSAVRCPHDGAVLTYKGLAADAAATTTEGSK